MAFLALIFLAFLQVQVGGPTQVNDPAYPMRLQVLQRNVSGPKRFMRSFGRADLYGQPGTPEQGLDYQADCGDLLLMVNHGAERYSARWKKPGHELEILASKIGEDKVHKCSVKVDLKPYLYKWDARDRQWRTPPLPSK